MQDTFCSHCGTKFQAGPEYPKTCVDCGAITYANPLPVVVAVLRRGERVVVVQRGIEPGRGKYALPGGFMEKHETWQQAAARECREEIGIDIAPERFRVLHLPDVNPLFSTPGGQLLIFVEADLTEAEGLAMQPDGVEVTDVALAHMPKELAFPAHTNILKAALFTRAAA